MTNAIIVGNGTSRANISVERLKAGLQAQVYACNAFYRGRGPAYTLPDWLVAIDDGMIAEIHASDFPKERFILPPEDERWEPAACNPGRPRSNAGMNAMIAAIRNGASSLYCIGFDFLLMSNREQSVSNIFDGTKNYGPETRSSWVDNYGRMRYLEWMANENKETRITFLFPEENYYDGYARPSSPKNLFVKPIETQFLSHT